MRWLFAAIVILNAVYFVWEHYVVADSGDMAVIAEHKFKPADAASLQLLAEMKLPPAQHQAVPIARLQSFGCPAFEFDGQQEAKLALDALSAHGIGASLEPPDGEEVAHYWVYLAPAGTRSQAIRKLRELQAKGIDSFVVSSGSDANAVSLGSFASRDSASGMQARLRAAGYQAEVREVRRSSGKYRVVLREASAQGYLEALPSEKSAGMRVDRRPCP